MPDGNAFFLLHNLLINLSWDNIVIIYHTLTGGADIMTSKAGPYPRLYPPSSSFKRHVAD